MRPDTLPISTEPSAPQAVETASAVAFAFADGVARQGVRAVAAEIPVEILFGGVSFGIMMATPADLEDFAYGFSLTEGAIGGAGDLRGIAIEPVAGAIRLRIDLAGERLRMQLARRRAMAGRTSCGLCGIDDLAALPRAGAPAGSAPEVALASIARALRTFEPRQHLNAATRAVHGAGWADLGGELLLVREDVGRHNALDKLVGACLRAGCDPARGFVLVTSRASFEMVEKTATFGARTLVAISAPTALAIARARALDVTLAGIARDDGVTLFHGAERIVASAPHEPAARPA